jgi:hypothetical protein
LLEAHTGTLPTSTSTSRPPIYREGSILDNLRSGRDFAFSLIDEALVFVDRGAFRELLIARDEEELTET